MLNEHLRRGMWALFAATFLLLAFAPGLVAASGGSQASQTQAVFARPTEPAKSGFILNEGENDEWVSWIVYSTPGPRASIAIEDTLVNYMTFDCSSIHIYNAGFDSNDNPDYGPANDVTSTTTYTCAGDSFTVSYSNLTADHILVVTIDAPITDHTHNDYENSATVTETGLAPALLFKTASRTMPLTPTPTSAPPTSTFTPVPPTSTFTPVPPTATFTSTPTDTPVPPTSTFTSTPTDTPVAPTSTFTSTPTDTPVAPTSTFTSTPTDTPVAPTSTPTSTFTPASGPGTITNTPEPPTETNTPEPPTATNTQVPTTVTNTPVPPTATNTQVPSTITNTPVPPTETNTPEPPTETNTPVPPTETNTPVPPTETNTPESPTATIEPTLDPGATETAEAGMTETAVAGATQSALITRTAIAATTETAVAGATQTAVAGATATEQAVTDLPDTGTGAGPGGVGENQPIGLLAVLLALSAVVLIAVRRRSWLAR